MADVLENILAYKRDEVARAKAERPLSRLEAEAKAREPARGFRHRLANRVVAGGFALIAEIKKASPSRGLIRADFDPATLARAYEAGGAQCLSVLTDAPSFQGAPDYLTAAREAASLPVLRKDFMIDPYQVVEARAWGADCILVILAAVDDTLAGELKDAAEHWGMTALIEVHDEAERDRALGLGAHMIGINNRDLKTFETRLETTERLAEGIPPGPLVISESGISTRGDLERLARSGVRAFLVGESLMRQRDVAAATRALFTGADAQSEAGQP